MAHPHTLQVATFFSILQKQPEFIPRLDLEGVLTLNKKLSYRRGTARHAVSTSVLSFTKYEI